MVFKIAVLASTHGTDMQAIIDEIEAGKIDAEISCVISNRQCYALERARQHKIEAIFIDPKNKTREEFDRLVVKELEKRKIDLVLLIGYMRIISDYFVGRYKNRIMNIHPSLLPAFAGGMDKDVHKTVLDFGAKVTGCTLHFVNETVDGGPIIFQKTVDISDSDTPESLKEKVQRAEQEVLLRAVRLFKEGKIKTEGSKVKIG
jgi:phosphoribosylglycinamide formyltransferase 1